MSEKPKNNPEQQNFDYGDGPIEFFEKAKDKRSENIEDTKQKIDWRQGNLNLEPENPLDLLKKSKEVISVQDLLDDEVIENGPSLLSAEEKKEYSRLKKKGERIAYLRRKYSKILGNI